LLDGIGLVDADCVNPEEAIVRLVAEVAESEVEIAGCWEGVGTGREGDDRGWVGGGAPVVGEGFVSGSRGERGVDEFASQRSGEVRAGEETEETD